MIQLCLFKLTEQSLFLSLAVLLAPFSLTLCDHAYVITWMFVLRFEYVVLFSDVSSHLAQTSICIQFNRYSAFNNVYDSYFLHLFKIYVLISSRGVHVSMQSTRKDICCVICEFCRNNNYLVYVSYRSTVSHFSIN